MMKKGWKPLVYIFQMNIIVLKKIPRNMKSTCKQLLKYIYFVKPITYTRQITEKSSQVLYREYGNLYWCKFISVWYKLM